jgi:hypothetical protein
MNSNQRYAGPRLFLQFAPALKKEALSEVLTVTGIAAGVISHFVAEGLKELASEGVREFPPGAFRGNAVLLRQIDGAFDRIKHTLLETHPEVRALKVFLSPERTIRSGVLIPLFEHIFQTKRTRCR